MLNLNVTLIKSDISRISIYRWGCLQ